MNREELERKLAGAQFHCEQCGACCRGPDNEVIVSPDEIDRITEITGLLPEDVAEPYPEWFEEHGSRFTFSRILRRSSDGSCRFLKNNRCSIYAVRPDLCRTYPFMLDGNNLLISECPALGRNPTEDVHGMADSLFLRREHDDRELAATKEVYQKHSMVSGATLIIDSRGVHIWKK